MLEAILGKTKYRIKNRVSRINLVNGEIGYLSSWVSQRKFLGRYITVDECDTFEEAKKSAIDDGGTIVVEYDVKEWLDLF